MDGTGPSNRRARLVTAAPMGAPPPRAVDAVLRTAGTPRAVAQRIAELRRELRETRADIAAQKGLPSSEDSAPAVAELGPQMGSELLPAASAPNAARSEQALLDAHVAELLALQQRQQSPQHRAQQQRTAALVDGVLHSADAPERIDQRIAALRRELQETEDALRLARARGRDPPSAALPDPSPPPSTRGLNADAQPGLPPAAVPPTHRPMIGAPDGGTQTVSVVLFGALALTVVCACCLLAWLMRSFETPDSRPHAASAAADTQTKPKTAARARPQVRPRDAVLNADVESGERAPLTSADASASAPDP